MFKVFVKTKKAIPGLSKILLALILFVAILFAFFVQRTKTAYISLELDKQIEVRISGGVATLRISSNWTLIDKKDLPHNVINGWKVNVGSRDNVRFYIGLLNRSDITGKLSVFSAVRKFFPLQNVFIEPAYAKSDVLPACVGAGAIIVGDRLVPLHVRVIFLPDGKRFVMMFVGGGNKLRSGSFVIWDKRIGNTFGYTVLEGVVNKVLSGKNVKLGEIEFIAASDSWIVRDKYFDMLRIQPIVADASKLWIAKIRMMSLPEYRKAEELLTDHFISLQSVDKTVNVRKVAINDKFVVYYGENSETINIAKEKYTYVELCWVGKSKSGEAFLISVHCEDSVVESARSAIKRLLRSVSLNKSSNSGNKERAIRVVDGVKLLKGYNVARGSGKIAGWYLLKLDGEAIGFEALSCSAFSRNRRLRITGLDYSYCDNGVVRYVQRERWDLFADDFTGKYLSKVDMSLLLSRRSRSHSIFGINEFLVDKIRTSVHIDDRVRGKEFVRPKCFLPDGGALLLSAAMADRHWRDCGFLMCAQVNMLNSHLQTVLFKRVARSDGVDVLILLDDELIYSCYKFDKDGLWQGIEVETGLKMKRVDERNIARLYRRQSGEAVKYFSEMSKIITGEN